MIAQASNLIQARDLLWEWTGRNIRARYQQSALGWLWAVVQPAAQVAIFTLIFTLFVPVNTGKTPYPLFSFVAIVPWTFLAASLTDMSYSLVSNMSLVTKIYFPRETLPIAAMLARLVDLAVAGGTVIVLMLYLHVPIFHTGWLWLPLILTAQLLLVLGLGLGCAAANVFYRDVQSLLTLCIQLWFYACPIIYPITMVPERLRPIYKLNPMAGLIEAYRDVLLNGHLPVSHLQLPLAISALVFVIGYWFFKRVEFKFADIV
jgi:homopolymeric O-antigen transport system permease protein